MRFSDKDGLDTRSNLEHFRDVAVNPLNPGSIYLFSGSSFVCNIMEKRVNGFSWFLWNVRHDTRNNQLNCFTVSHLGAPGVFVSNTTVKSMSRFLWNFQDMLAMTHGTIWNILEMIGFTPWAQVSFFIFWSVFVGNITEYRKDGHS